MRILSFIILYIVSFSASAQVTIIGNVTDAKTNNPIAFVNVYVTNTQLGATTDAKGNYKVKEIPRGRVELIFSVIGYGHTIKAFETGDLSYLKLDVKLQPSATDLSEVNIVAQKGSDRKKQLKRFEKAFLGFTSNASKCTILNPEVLVFEEKNGYLRASSKDFIKIENRATGYEVSFLLDYFELQGEEVTYAGKPFFKPLEPKNKKEAKRWKKRRVRTYNGSIRHFLSALINDQLKEAGYTIEMGQVRNNGKFLKASMPSASDLVIDGKSKYEKILLLPNYALRVTYKKERGLASKSLADVSLGKENATTLDGNIGTVPPTQVSFLFALNSQIAINYNGLLKQPLMLKEYDYWANERIADLLPIEYLPEGLRLEEPEDNAPKINEFKLTNLKVAEDEIRKNTPKRDDIPAIDKPYFVKSSKVNYLSDDDWVLGVTYNNVSKAYPIRILNWHEVVNDVFGDTGVVVTYCPLCASAVAFKSEVNGERYSFGVSGLLYNSDVLLYDRTTQSLWSQILGKSIAGKNSGTELLYISTTMTTWKDWKNTHPETLVLTTKTGFERNYNKIPYGNYPNSNLIYFPVSNEDDRFHKKEKVLGITVNGKYKAYPFSELSKKESPIIDTFEGETIEIIFDKQQQIAKVKNPKTKAFTLYWFAWFAFHPDTEVFE